MHELTMVCQHLPRSCKLKKLAGHLNSQWDIKPCPGDNGIQQSLSLRLKEQIKYLLQQKEVTSGDILKVKISGDGTKICQKLNLFNFTFTLLNEKAIAKSPKGNHTIAVINGTEDYELLKTSLSDIIEEIRTLSSITMNNVTFPIAYYLCGDLKFLAIVCGIESATATYLCVWCTCASSERHDMSKEWSVTDVNKGAQTINSIISCHTKCKSKRMSCIHPPLFQSIPIDHVIPDILHLYLRITDVLFNLLITDILRYDGITKATTTNIESESTYIPSPIGIFINTTCKISFKFFISKDSKQLSWRDLMGPEKHVVFEKILLVEIFPKLPHVQDIQNLWDNFQKLYTVLQKEEISTEESVSFTEDAKQWVLDFTTVYQAKNVTPYIHILSKHIPELLHKYKNINQFTQQGREIK